MRRLLIFLVVSSLIIGLAVAALAYADVRLRELAESQAESRLNEAVPQARRGDVEIDAFPFVGWVLLDGSVERLVVTLHALREGDVEVERFRLSVDGLVLDRERLLDEHVLAVTSIDRVRIEGRITADAAARALGVPVELTEGTVRVGVQGRATRASLSVSGRTLVLSITGTPPLVIPLPPEAYLPCRPEVAIEEDRLTVACSATALPPAVMAVLAEDNG